MEGLKSYRSPSWQYKIKQLTTYNKTGDAFCINIPRVIANNFKDIYFNMMITDTSIILESGCKHGKNQSNASIG